MSRFHLVLAIEQMQAGRTVIRRFTVPEGLTVAEVLKIVREVEGLEGNISLRPAEGTLLPETYHYSLGMGPAARGRDAGRLLI